MISVAISYALTYDRLMHTIDIRPLHRIAVLHSVDLADTVGPADLTRPTPCGQWDLGDLLTHMTAQHIGFAAAARGNGADPAPWQTAGLADAVRRDPAGSYRAAATDVLDAFAADDVLDAEFALPDFGPDAVFPGNLAIGFHFVDYVVHGWDVARALDVSYQPPAAMVEALLPLVMAIPDGDFRAAPDSPFGPASTATATTDFDRILAHLGRHPGWAAAGSAQPNSTVTGA